MITRRAKRWMRWGALMLTLAVVATLVGATWYYAARIEDELLAIPPDRFADPGLVVGSVGPDGVTLPRTADTERPGRWGLDWAGGHARLGPVTERTGDTVTRELIDVTGDLRPGLDVTWDAVVYPTNPSDLGIEFRNVTFRGPLGIYPAWVVDGDDDTWVIFVHGAGGTPAEALRILPTVVGLGFPAMAITYRNDDGAPASDSGRSALGESEWRDLEAAVEYAFSEGAQDVVVVGYSLGGSITSMFLHGSDRAERVQGVVFDAPLLDVGMTVDVAADDLNVPAFLVAAAKSLATLRFGVDWDDLDQVERAEEFTVPILLFHGDDDRVVPIASSDEFAGALPDLVRYERVAGAGHVQSWNVDPAHYEDAVAEFLTEVALGPTDLELLELE